MHVAMKKIIDFDSQLFRKISWILNDNKTSYLSRNNDNFINEWMLLYVNKTRLNDAITFSYIAYNSLNHRL